MSYSRKKVLKALHDKGCRFLREGSRHTILESAAGGRVEVPRHRDVKPGTARNIARQAGVAWHEFEQAIS
jgi:predicted RNA binding protein YcfA (HicA-like mRNA interferase family)